MKCITTGFPSLSVRNYAFPAELSWVTVRGSGWGSTGRANVRKFESHGALDPERFEEGNMVHRDAIRPAVHSLGISQQHWMKHTVWGASGKICLRVVAHCSFTHCRALSAVASAQVPHSILACGYYFLQYWLGEGTTFQKTAFFVRTATGFLLVHLNLVLR